MIVRFDDTLLEGLHEQLLILQDLYQRTVGDLPAPKVCILCFETAETCACDQPAPYAVGIALAHLSTRIADFRTNFELEADASGD